MKNTYDISIIIVNYNTTPFLIKCLNSIKNNFGENEIEVTVVDNNSSEELISNLRQDFLWVNFYFRKVNDGFAGGCNYGAERSSGKYFLFMNPDVLIKDKSLLNLKTYLGENENAGVVSGVMYNYNDSILYFYNEFPTVSWELYHLIGTGYDAKISQLINNPSIRSGKNFEVDWFHGAFFMIRREDFFNSGSFNEKYFMYYEDVELCYIIKNKLNKKNVCLPLVKYYHHTQSSISKQGNDDIYTFHLHRGKLIFIRNYSLFKRFVIYLLGIFYVLSRIGFLPVWNKYKGLKKHKLLQLLNVLKLYLSNDYLDSSKYVYIKK